MFTNLITIFPAGISRWSILVVILALSIPITLGEFLHYDLCITFLLAPLIALAIFQQPTVERNLYIACLVGGVISCLVGAYHDPEHSLLRSFLSLTLVLYAMSFLFLGSYAGQRQLDRRAIMRLLSACCSVFGIMLVLRVLWLNEPVQIEPDGYSRLNAWFLGLPVFGSYGVLSLAHLWCMQALLCCVVIFGVGEKLNERLFSCLGLASLLFLMASSNSRGAEIAVAFVAIAIGIYLVINPPARKWAGLVLAAYFIFAALYAVHSPPRGSRLVQTIILLLGQPVQLKEPAASSKTSDSPTAAMTNMSTITSGRDRLVKAAMQDVIRSPFLGNGFTGYGHSGNYKLEDATLHNSSTHIYYLTLLWKGGLLFVLPWILLIGRSVHKVWQQRSQIFHSEFYFPATAVSLMFLFLTLQWDTLIVPSAGALAYFLLGLLTNPAKAR